MGGRGGWGGGHDPLPPGLPWQAVLVLGTISLVAVTSVRHLQRTRAHVACASAPAFSRARGTRVRAPAAYPSPTSRAPALRTPLSWHPTRAPHVGPCRPAGHGLLAAEQGSDGGVGGAGAAQHAARVRDRTAGARGRRSAGRCARAARPRHAAAGARAAVRGSLPCRLPRGGLHAPGRPAGPAGQAAGARQVGGARSEGRARGARAGGTAPLHAMRMPTHALAQRLRPLFAPSVCSTGCTAARPAPLTPLPHVGPPAGLARSRSGPSVGRPSRWAAASTPRCVTPNSSPPTPTAASGSTPRPPGCTEKAAVWAACSCPGAPASTSTWCCASTARRCRQRRSSASGAPRGQRRARCAGLHAGGCARGRRGSRAFRGVQQQHLGHGRSADRWSWRGSSSASCAKHLWLTMPERCGPTPSAPRRHLKLRCVFRPGSPYSELLSEFDRVQLPRLAKFQQLCAYRCVWGWWCGSLLRGRASQWPATGGAHGLLARLAGAGPMRLAGCSGGAGARHGAHIRAAQRATLRQSPHRRRAPAAGVCRAPRHCWCPCRAPSRALRARNRPCMWHPTSSSITTP